MKSFITQWVISILVNLRYLRLKLLKYKETTKKICDTFDNNKKNIPVYVQAKYHFKGIMLYYETVPLH